MKKLIYFLMVTLVTVFTFSSCSNDDDSGSIENPKNSYLKVTIDGNEKTFNTIVVNKRIVEYTGSINETVLDVTASINNDPTEKITFTVEDGQVGSEALWNNFEYYFNDKVYYNQSYQEQSYIISKNSENKLEGTFRAKLYDNQGVNFKDLTKGEFKIKY